MKTELLTHLVPSLPPQAGGVGEYALNLGRHLRDHCGVNSQFILCDANWNGPARIEDFVVRRLRFPNDARLWGLLASLREDPVLLLHYDGKSYQKNGCPTWLHVGIQSWLEDRDSGSPQRNKQFFTVFHELWGSLAKPWQGQFYRNIWQRRLVEKLHRRSQVSITSTRHYQAELDGMEPGKTMLLPIPSTLPVVDRILPRARRDQPLLVAISAQNGSGSETIRAHANLLRTFDKTNRLAGVMLLGGPVNGELALLEKCVSPNRIKVLENVNPGDVSLLLNRADVFLSAQAGAVAGKSAALMSAMSAGCVTVLREGRDAAPLQEGVHFIASDDSSASVERFARMAADGKLEDIASAGRNWYQHYADWKVIALKFQEALETPMPVALVPELRLATPWWSMPATTR
jgi:hypothetical protein